MTDWELNEKPLPSGTKFIPSVDFGFVRLEINDALVKNSGLLKVTATNSMGTASTSGTLKILPEGSNVSTTSLHPSGQTGIEAIEAMETSTRLKLGDDSADQSSLEKPHFVSDLQAECEVCGEEPLHLQCTVEPKSDPGLRVDWYHNGQPLKTGARVQANIDFGFVTLNITDVSARDEGIYTCKAVNSLGEATTFTKVYYSTKSPAGVDSTTMHPRGEEGLENINKMEARGALPDSEEDVQMVSPPQFVRDFTDTTLEQGAVGYFEANLEPRKDGTMSIEWIFNNKPLLESSRFKKTHAFGMVILEIMGIRKSDEGKYTCVAKNKAGTAESSFNLSYSSKDDKDSPKFTSQIKVASPLHLEIENFNKLKPRMFST